MTPRLPLRRARWRARPAALLALVALSATCAPAAPAERPRSVILVSIDTLRADHLGLYGYERDTSPFLDRFAARSIVFEHAFTSAAWTLIAHMTMLTGLYPEQHGVVRGTNALAPDVPLLAERLKAAGYQTLGFYRPGWIHPRHGFERGFDVFRMHYPAEQAEIDIGEELPKLDPDRPAFLFLHLFDVHNDPATADEAAPFSAPPPFQDLFVPDARKRMEGENYLTLKKREITPDLREALGGLYDDGIRHVDSVLERILTRLESEPCFRDALVIVTADHGESLAQRGRMTGHGGPWQEGLHIPLIVHLPQDERAGQRVSEVTHLVDVVATVLDFAGLPLDPELPGRSLLRPLPPDRVVTGGHTPVEYSVRWPEKMVRFGKKVGRFDLEHDPAELEGVEAEDSEYEAMRAGLDLDPKTFHTPLTIQPREEDMAELEALGYGGGD